MIKLNATYSKKVAQIGEPIIGTWRLRNQAGARQRLAEELSELSKDSGRFAELVAEANGELALKQNAKQAEQAVAQE